MSADSADLLVVLGPTASGKTRLAVGLAAALGGEIISADSRQVFRGMDIGTGKDLAEYQLSSGPVPYHLIDIAEPGEPYHVHRFQQEFAEAFAAIRRRGRLPILCGGTGMYVLAVLQQAAFTAIPVNEALRQQLENLPDEELLERFAALDSPYHLRADLSTRRRRVRALEIAVFLQENQVPVSPEKQFMNPVIIGLNPNVPQRRELIAGRLQQRLQEGLIQEVQGLLAAGVPESTLLGYGLEYRFVTGFLAGKYSLAELEALLTTAIHQFAKRQMTFFRKMERDGLHIHWLPDGLNQQERLNEALSLWAENRAQ